MGGVDQARIVVTASPRKAVALWSIALYAAWTATWLGHDALARGALLPLHQPQFDGAWWLVAKLVIWVIPVWCIVQSWGVGSVWAWLGLDRTSGMARGFLIAAVWVCVCIIVDGLVPGRWPGDSRSSSSLGFAVLSTLISTLPEEILYRGFALRALVESGLGFWPANAVAAILFVLLHVPGWIFMGRHLSAISTLVPGIFSVGLVCGMARGRDRSLWASVVVHSANNLWSGGLLLALVRRFG